MNVLSEAETANPRFLNQQEHDPHPTQAGRVDCTVHSGLGRILLPPTSPPTSPATSSPPSPPPLALIASPSRWIEVLQICKSVWLPKKPWKLEECHKFCETRPHTKLLRDKSRSFSLGGTITGGSFDLCMQEHWRGGSKVLNHRNLNAATIINEQERRKSLLRLVARSVSCWVVQEQTAMKWASF